MGVVTDGDNLFYREGGAERHGGFDQQTFREQTMAGLRRALDQLMGYVGFCALQAADKQRRFSLKLAQGEGHLGQHRILMVAEGEGGFPFFIQKRIGAQADGKLLFIFTG